MSTAVKIDEAEKAGAPVDAGTPPVSGMRLDMQELVLSRAVRRQFAQLNPLELAVLHAIADYPMATGTEIGEICGCHRATVSEIRNANWFGEAYICLLNDREPTFTTRGQAMRHLGLSLIGREWTEAALKDKKFEPTVNQLTFLRGCGVLNPDAHVHLHAPGGSGAAERMDRILADFLEPFTPEKRDHKSEPILVQALEAE